MLLQTFARLTNPIVGHCAWKYEKLNAVQQSNIQRCYSSTYQQYLSFKAYEDHLFNDVYRRLVREAMLVSFHWCSANVPAHIHVLGIKANTYQYPSLESVCMYAKLAARPLQSCRRWLTAC